MKRQRNGAGNGQRNGNGIEAAGALFRRVSASGLTLTEALVAFEIARRQQAGEPTNLVEVAKGLEMPISTVSRVTSDLCDRHGLMRQEASRSDRRMKLLVIDLQRVEQIAAAA